MRQFRWHEQFHGIPWNSMELGMRQFSWHKQFHGIPWNSMELELRQFRWQEQFHGIPRNLWCANFDDTKSMSRTYLYRFWSGIKYFDRKRASGHHVNTGPSVGGRRYIKMLSPESMLWWHASMLYDVPVTTAYKWFRKWIGVEWVASHCKKGPWSSYLACHCATSLKGDALKITNKI